MNTRREGLKIIGAISTTCAFPFSAGELYGQHAHPPLAAAQAPAGPYTPKSFSAAEFELISRIADLIIPPTDTPGAVAAGVPQYIDLVVQNNPDHLPRFRAGVEWLDRAAMEKFGAAFRSLSTAQQIEILTPLSDALDHERVENAGERFFRLMKSMTADGYYTSRIGLVQELGYKGNTVLPAFPECTHPEHH
jgi:hypothetical protein